MEVQIYVRLALKIPDNEEIPIAQLTHAVKGQQIEKRVLEGTIQKINDTIIEQLCGEKSEQGNGQKPFQRAGTTTRSPVTIFGELDLRLSKVKNISNNTTSIPLYQSIAFDGKRKFQPDIGIVVVDLSQKLSYRDVVTEVSLFFDVVPTPTTINQRVVEYGEKIPIKTENGKISVGIGDGTKCHSQEPGCKQNRVNVLIGVNDGKKTLLGVTVNKPWEDIAKTIETDNAFAEYATIVSDGEKELRSAFSDEKRQFQMDLIHAFRMLSFKLWEDKQLDFEERKKLVNELKKVVLSLKNVVIYQKADKEKIKTKISSTLEDLKRIAKELKEKRCYKSAEFIREYSNAMVTFARLAIEGIIIPWTSNIIERLMGEISKRVKHKWMRWTTRGLEAILRLILVRYTDKQAYNTFRDEILGRTPNNRVSCIVSITKVQVGLSIG